MMIFMDPPGHDELRRLVSRAFTPRRVAALEDRTRELCAQFLDPHRDGDGFDFVEDFAAKIPAMLIGALLGVPDEDQDQLRIWGDLLMRFEPHGISAEKLDAIASLDALHVGDGRRTASSTPATTWSPTSSRRRSPATTAPPRRLDFDEVMAFFTLLQLAGQRDHRPAPGLGRGAARPPSGPAGEARRDARSSRPTRSRSCCATRRRRRSRLASSTRDVEWHGQKVPQYSKLAMLTGSAGRDEREFADADRFDVERTLRPSRHVRLRHPLLPGRQPGPPRRPDRARGDARPVPALGRRRGRGRDGANVDRARPGARARSRSERSQPNTTTRGKLMETLDGTGSPSSRAARQGSDGHWRARSSPKA